MKKSLTRGFTRGSKGFTLIELLVVIAIIGILASIILASLSSARSKGSDASIKSNLNTVQTQMEVVVGSTGDYSLLCTDPTIGKALTSAQQSSPATSVNTTLATLQGALVVECHGSTTGWAASAPLQTNSSWFWCVDSTGRAGTTTNPIAASAVVCS